MTQEMMQKMTRKEWRVYNKRMKALEWKDIKFPQRTSLEEMNELRVWRKEKKYRQNKREVTAQLILSVTSFSVGLVGLIIALICILS